MPLKRLDTVIPGGYAYEQRDSGGTLLKKFHTTTMPFGHFVRTIQQFREANKLARVTIQETWADVDEEQCRRIGYDPEWCQKKNSMILSRSQPRRRSAAVAAAVSSFVNLKRGAETLLDWHEDGFVPVEKEKAQNRADICSRSNGGLACPHNQDIPYAIANGFGDIVKKQIEKKSGMKLSVDGEENLHLCLLCNCVLKLKVWTPMETIKGRMNPEEVEKFKTYPACWMNFA